MPKLVDVTGQRFGRLVALEYLRPSRTWTCRCDCGTVTRVGYHNLKAGKTSSCGCLNRELAAARKRTHGLTGTPEYISWSAAKGRCENPTNKRYAAYGGRGITMCAAWADDFTAFLRDVGPRPSPKHTLDRINVDGPYEPGNVRWATTLQQANNTRFNRYLTWNGKTQTLADWARELSLVPETIHNRLHTLKWPVARALSIPALQGQDYSRAKGAGPGDSSARRAARAKR